jgi:dienelactone hydrolase
MQQSLLLEELIMFACGRVPSAIRSPVLFCGTCLALLFGFPTPACCFGDDLAFRRHVLNADSEFTSAAVFDVNKDGKLDIVCGGYWYEAPTWKKHFLRTVEILGGRPDGYAHQVLDVNGDGWPDLITVNWRSSSIKWIEHPGANLAKEQEWKAHVIAVPGSSETGRLVDLVGDGTPAILPCGANFSAWWELRRKPNPLGGLIPEWIRHELPRELAGHGIGIGDINGDGRQDLVGRSGWAEAPKDPRNGRWIWHPDFDLDQASIPILVVDVDGDGLNDIVWTRAHDYGIYWLQQTRTQDNQIRWIKHAIDTSVAGCHAPLWEDLDGDGKKELIVGRRYLAHEGRDPGEYDPQAAYRYQFDPKTRTWQRWLISYNDGVCFGLDPKAVDLTGSGKLDLICGGRHGLYWLENLGKGNAVAKGLTKDPLWFPTYRDRLNLLVVQDEAGKEKPVRDAFDWGQRRAQILAAAQSVLGALPDSHQRVPLDLRVLSETATANYVRKKITYGSDLDSRATAYLLLPDNVRRGAPALICLHDDTPLGKDEPAGLGGRDSLHYADDLAQRGYVCLVPDYPSFGDNAYDFKKHAGTYASGSMKAVWDNIRGIDLLETLPEVSNKRIGILGHGLGGQSALLTAVFDSRLAAVVSSCGFTTFPRYKGGDLADWATARRMPRIRDVYHNDPSKIPFDFAELLGTLVPRSVFVSAPLHDPMMDVEGVKSAIASASAVYQLRKVSSSLRVMHPDSGHDFTEAARAEAYTWLDQRLKR